MEKLYIIGNGFDLCHKLPTSYNDFHKYIIASRNDMEDIFEEYFNFKKDGNSLWENFEEDLGTFEWKSFFDNNCQVDLTEHNFKISATYSLEDDLNEQSEQLKIDISSVFENWLESVDISRIQKRVVLPEDAFFISFNYTLTLERVYGIQQNKILHIHGDIVNNPGELIFGHNKTLEEIPELDENGNSNRTIFTDSENAAKSLLYDFLKPVTNIIEYNKKTFELMDNVKEIYVLGHSLNQIDIPYFKEIAEKVPKAKWNVSFYDPAEKGKHLFALNQIGAARECIRLFHISEIISEKY